MTDLIALTKLNQQRWDKCHIPLSKASAFRSVAQRLTAPTAKARYQSVEKRTGVPWWFIAVVHQREASQSWEANLAQGDPWNKVSTHVPAGRGPFKSWEDAAVDALTKCPPYASRNKDWTPGGALTMLEQYNGLGYANRNVPSPYLWSGTDQYTKGKYVADHVYDPNVVDLQLGCAGLLKFMGIFNKTISTPTVVVPTIATTAAVASTPSHYWPYIIGAGILVFMGWTIYSVIKSYRNQKNA